jgi:hypothetical protein
MPSADGSHQSRVGTAYTPRFPSRINQDKLVTDVSHFLGLKRPDVQAMLGTYRSLHEQKMYTRTLGELKTLCFEEAFIVCCCLSAQQPRTIVEIGTQHGKSTRRIIDMKTLIGVDSPIVCFDVSDQVQHFVPSEARLILKDVTGKFRHDVLETYGSGFIFLDVHSYALLREAVSETIAFPGDWMLAIHDCGRGLFNPHMTLSKEDQGVTSFTGIWERQVLAEVFGIADPLNERLDGLETATHKLRIFDTPHGLGLIRRR